MLKPAKGRPLSLWESCWSAIQSLRPAFSRQVSFMWFATVVAGLMVRPELRGVTSIIRALNSRPKLYDPLRKHFHSSAIKLDRLAALWTQAVLRLFPQPLRVNGRCVVVGDGIKVPKRGRKMPGVKLLHQQSESNTKPEYIMGHSLQAVSLLVNAAKGVEQLHRPLLVDRPAEDVPAEAKRGDFQARTADHTQFHPDAPYLRLLPKPELAGSRSATARAPKGCTICHLRTGS